MNNHNNNAADHIIGKRVVDRTRKNYQYKLNTLKIFVGSLTDDHGEPLDGLIDEDGEFILPLPANIIEQIFGWLSVNTDLPKRARRGVEEEENDD